VDCTTTAALGGARRRSTAARDVPIWEDRHRAGTAGDRRRTHARPAHVGPEALSRTNFEPEVDMARPIRVGILHDMSDDVDDEMPDSSLEARVRPALGALAASGRLDRDVEFVHAAGMGLPEGTAAAVKRAFRALDEQDVLLVVGPAVGDNALVATPLADQARLPTINWAGTERARSDYMFHLQVGSHEEESVLLARHVGALGARRVVVIYDRSPIGRRYAAFFDAECEVLGLDLTARIGIAPLADDATNEMAAAQASGADALVYLGLGLVGTAVARARRDVGWDVPVAMNSAGLRGYEPSFGSAIEGWVYVDMVADDNQVLAELRGRGDAPAVSPMTLAVGHDLGQLVAEGLARAPELTREGVREGLELVKLVPAAEGRRGTTLGFGHLDHGALHGEYLVLRQWQGGSSVEIAR
jgi:ABC-type branched-subunit amino acid transport system substrate-binding protein